MKTTKTDIRALSLEELREYFVKNGHPSFRGNQVYEWLWKKAAQGFDEMTNISLELRDLLEQKYVINHIHVNQMQRSQDGTIKNAVGLFDDNVVESVLIPAKNRITACVSAQVGCSLDCTFCATAALKRMRNLNPDEIYDQVVTIAKQSRDFYNMPLTNIVFMGMGEPLMNYKNVLLAIDKITLEEGLHMSPKRITLSTSGVPKMIKKLADDGVKFNLAVSLHSAIQTKREQIMPFCKSFPLEDLLESLQYWYAKTKKQITFEYIIWKGVNDEMEDIQALVNYCKKVPSKVNIIQYNSIDNQKYQQAHTTSVDLYIKKLEQAGVTATIRQSRGDDIDAACGQLANKELLN